MEIIILRGTDGAIKLTCQFDGGGDLSSISYSKQYILAGKISFEEELKLCDLVLTKHVKSTETWAHRYV
mgnify:CR=1 FL=1